VYTNKIESFIDSDRFRMPIKSVGMAVCPSRQINHKDVTF